MDRLLMCVCVFLCDYFLRAMKMLQLSTLVMISRKKFNLMRNLGCIK